MLSDLAPKLTGIGPRDAAQAAALAAATRAPATHPPGPGGTLVTKPRGGEQGESARIPLKAPFARVPQRGTAPPRTPAGSTRISPRAWAPSTTAGSSFRQTPAS